MTKETVFENALNKATDTERARNGIGMQSEKTLHLFLKNYLQPDENFHEVKVGRFVADILCIALKSQRFRLVPLMQCVKSLSFF